MPIKGILYRKLFEKERSKKKPKSSPSKSRASRLAEKLKYQEPEIPVEKKEGQKYPEFKILPSKKKKSIVSVGNNRFRYFLLRPYAYADIRYDPEEENTVYHLIEPTLTEKEKKLYEKIKEGLIQTINVELTKISKNNKVISFLEEKVQGLLDDYGRSVSDQSYLKIMYYIYRDFIGLGRIEPLMRDPFIEDISCDGIGVEIYVVHQRYGSVETDIVFEDEDELRDFVVKLAEKSDRYISYADPLLDGTLSGGSRVQASLASDVTTKGPSFSIRKFRETPFTPVDLMDMDTVSLDMLSYLWFLIEHERNILIGGGVATGKTTLLNAISLFIRPQAKIVSIEDTRELSLPHENWIPGVSRVGFGSSKRGEVSMYDLLKESFRQKPDYLIVGEVRGKEASVMFQAMASGHPSLATIHAGSIEDVIRRLKTPPINLPAGLMEELDDVLILVHARDQGESARRISKVTELESITQGRVNSHDFFEWEPENDAFKKRDESITLKNISEQRGMSMESIEDDLEEKKKILTWLYKRKDDHDWTDVARYISMYYENKDKLSKLMKK